MNRIAKIAAGQILGLIDGKQVLGLDIAKLVFQMHTVNMTTSYCQMLCMSPKLHSA